MGPRPETPALPGRVGLVFGMWVLEEGATFVDLGEAGAELTPCEVVPSTRPELASCEAVPEGWPEAEGTSFEAVASDRRPEAELTPFEAVPSNGVDKALVLITEVTDSKC